MRTWVVAESNSSLWSYHLREVQNGEVHYGGHTAPAVCGVETAWDTRIPLNTWGRTDGRSTWCGACARELGLEPRPKVLRDGIPPGKLLLFVAVTK